MAPAWCQHVYDVMGCDWNMPANYAAGTFERCAADSGQVGHATVSRASGSTEEPIFVSCSPWVSTAHRPSTKVTPLPHLLTLFLPPLSAQL